MNKKCIAIIPARGGSKRIPKKNIKNFLGKPIISYPIITALETGVFNEVMVSTDDLEIANIAMKFGAKVPFTRSKDTSDDYSGVADVILEVLTKYQEIGKEYDYFCCILPTAPFANSKLIKKSLNILIENKFDGIITVQKYSYPIQRSLKIEDNYIKMNWAENYDKRSQDLEPVFHDSGQFYWMSVNAFKKQKKMISERCGAIILSEMEAHDIDTEDDWRIAEMKYLINQNSFRESEKV